MARQVRFGDWHFCLDTGVLDRDGTVVSLEPRVAALLQYFLDHPGELLSRDQLIAEVWEGRVVSDDAIRRAVSSLRRALALDGSDKLITTVHKKGYLANLLVPVPVPGPGPAPMPLDAGVEAAP
ncbi:MAG: transcriptional regulator, partial [Haliea sp.]